MCRRRTVVWYYYKQQKKDLSFLKGLILLFKMFSD
nr:MAG TPA: hypothetical protein [Caudoviricetes sp.]